MIKITKVFYPHIVKQYDTVDQIVSENNYTDYVAILKNSLTNAGVDISDASNFQEALTEDKFEGVTTFVYPDESTRDTVVADIESQLSSFNCAQPIFEEEITDHLF